MSAVVNTQYPQPSDLLAFISQCGLAAPVNFTGVPEMASAIAELERKTGWWPFLAAGSQVRLFDPPGAGPNVGHNSSYRGGRTLELGTGILNMPDNGVRIGVTPNTTGVTGVSLSGTGSAGAVLTRGIQYFMLPVNAQMKGLPWTAIQFNAVQSAMPQSIQITATWGRFLQLPDDVWYGILQRAFAIARPKLSISITGGAGRITDEKTTVDWNAGGAPLETEVDQIMCEWKQIIRDHRRVTA